MSNFIEAIFVIQLLTFIALIFAKLYNIMYHGEETIFETSFIIFIGILINFGIGFVTTISDMGTNLLISQLFVFQSFLLVLGFLFFIIEIIFYLQKKITGPTEAYTPKRN